MRLLRGSVPSSVSKITSPGKFVPGHPICSSSPKELENGSMNNGLELTNSTNTTEDGSFASFSMSPDVLDLSLRIKRTPEKGEEKKITSIVQVFSSLFEKAKRSEREEKEQTVKKAVKRLNFNKYGEILTHEKVVERFQKAEAEKEEKKQQVEERRKQRVEKQLQKVAELQKKKTDKAAAALKKKKPATKRSEYFLTHYLIHLHFHCKYVPYISSFYILLRFRKT